jgi:chemotaxis protein MotB
MVKESTYLKKVEEADGLTKNLTDLQERCHKLTAEHERLLADLAKAQEKNAGLENEQKALQSDIKGLEHILKSRSDELSRNITELRLKVGDLEKENAGLKEQIAAIQKQKEEKAKEVREVSKTYEDLLDKMKNEISQGQVTISELKGKLTVNMLDAILFDSGKAEVKEEGMTVLRKVLEILKQVKDKAIRIEGHTDNVTIVGALAKKYPTNWELSAARAINVSRFLQLEGIDPAILSAVAYGEYHPVADNGTDEGKARNRRIEIILVPKE